MEITQLKVLVNNISSFFQLSAHENVKCEPVQKYYRKAIEVLKLLKPVLDAIIGTKITTDEKLFKAFTGLEHSVEDLLDLFESWQLLMSKVYFVLQVEALMVKVQNFILEILELLKSTNQSFSPEFNIASLELYVQKVKHISYEQVSPIITQAVKDHFDGSGARSDSLVKIAESLRLKSNQELLIEAVALEKLKENAEQDGKNGDVEWVDKMIALVTHMHERLVMMKQSQSYSSVPIPPDFRCPLSLELMTDPVIVASGQTYERAFIRKWIDLGLTFCPKTRQTLAHTNLIPNYTVKALIANWCETNYVKLPDPLKSMSLSEPALLLACAESGSPMHISSQLHSRASQSGSPNQSLSSPSKGMISSTGIQSERSPFALTRSSSEESLPEVDGNEHGLDIRRIRISEDRLINASDRSGQLSTSPSRHNASLADEHPIGHNRSTSTSSTLSDSNFSQGLSGEGNEMASQSMAYGSDASGEVVPDNQHVANLTTTSRELEVPTLVDSRSRSQKIWRRPSDRFFPRIVTTPVAEPRADLSGVEAQVRTLVEDLKSTSLDIQAKATAELRLLAKHNMDNRIVIANCGAIGLLVDLLRSTGSKIQENAVTALLNLSIYDDNKTAIANAGAIEPLIHVLETGTAEARENSAATLFSLSVIEENKVKIGRSGAIKPLVDLLGNGTPRGKKDAATALFNLSIFHENKGRIVEAGAVKYLVELMDPAAGMVDKAVAVLSNLATIQEGRTAIGQEGGIPVLVEVVELGSARGKENAAAALLQLCTSSNRFCNMVLQEGAVPPLVALSQSGTPRAKEKAQALLSYFRNQRHGNAGRS